MTGRRLGVYQLHERVGAGGMGEVYRARDTRLQRDVAVKILPEAFAADGERRARFEREAVVLASLNHPNIATIHGIEDGDGIHALVMELVDGETIAERLQRGPMRVPMALDVARQIAEALDVAHERGIVHRDLKPANVMLSSSGRVKVLDFGLAKAVDAGEAGAGPTNLATTLGVTQEGRFVGTPAYMSPEQLRGRPLDRRTDIWAFGCVLYEMITGHGAFAGQTRSDTIAAILERDPDWDALRAAAPGPATQLVQHCLAKDPRLRLRDIGDARLRIDDVLAAPSEAPGSSVSAAPRTGTRLLAAVALACTAGIALALYLARPAPSIGRPAQFMLSLAGQSADFTPSSTPSPSPDGRRFVFVGTNEKGASMLWLRGVESGEARSIPGTDEAQTPIWSPDGRWVAFFADGTLKRVAVDGGRPETIAALPGFLDASWGSQGVIIYRPSNRQSLFRISETGGEAAPLTRLNEALGENSHRGATFLPDGERFLFTARCSDSANNALYLGSLDSPALYRVMSAQSKALYLPAQRDGASVLLYYRDGGLEARTFDPDRRALGDPEPVIANVDYNATGIGAFFQASADGRVIVVRPAGSATHFTWFERNGEQAGTLGGPGDFSQPRLSPKGDRVAFSRADPKNGNRDVWTIEIERGIAAPLTRNAANDWHPVWSANGTQLLFNSDREGKADGRLFLKQAIDASAEETQLLDVQSAPTDWSRDGRWMAVQSEFTLDLGDNIAIVSSSDRTLTRLPDAPSRNGALRFSPDGRWVAYTSDEPGRFEVFVRPFADGVVGREKIRISESGGDFPLWRPDGQELYFMSEDATIHAVSTSALRLDGPVPRPQALFRPCPGSTPQSPPMTAQFWGIPFDTRDGQRFIVNCFTRPSREYVLLMNWPLGEGR